MLARAQGPSQCAGRHQTTDVVVDGRITLHRRTPLGHTHTYIQRVPSRYSPRISQFSHHQHLSGRAGGPRKGRSDGRHAFVARSAASQKRNVIARRKSPEISMYLDQALPAHSRLGLAAESSATTLGAPAGEAHNLAPSARNDRRMTWRGNRDWGIASSRESRVGLASCSDP